MTNFGCVNGGVPRCRVNNEVSNDGPFGAMDPLSCQGPTKQLNEWDFIVARTAEKPACICPSGLFPVCTATGNKPRCPDGELAQRSLTNLPDFLELCKHPDE